MFYFVFSGETLKCYSTNDSVVQQQWTQCDDRKGFRTCFTKYNMSELQIQIKTQIQNTKHKIQNTQCDDRKGFRTCFTKYNMSELQNTNTKHKIQNTKHKIQTAVDTVRR